MKKNQIATMSEDELVDLCRDIERQRQIGLKFNDELARERARQKAASVFTRRIVVIGSFEVETWWDRFSMNWISQIKNKQTRDEIACDYSGNKIDAATQHVWNIIQASEMSK